MSQLMSNTIYHPTLKGSVPNAKVENEISKTKKKEFISMNARDLDTFRWNVPISLENKKRVHFHIVR